MINHDIRVKMERKRMENERKEIIINIIKTKTDLDSNRKNYEFAEKELIDYYLYQIKANQSKLDYLIKKAKDKNIILDVIEKSKFDVV